MFHTYYNRCENCGALLDPGEHCSCQEEQTDDKKGEEHGKRNDEGSKNI